VDGGCVVERVKYLYATIIINQNTVLGQKRGIPLRSRYRTTLLKALKDNHLPHCDQWITIQNFLEGHLKHTKLQVAKCHFDPSIAYKGPIYCTNQLGMVRSRKLNNLHWSEEIIPVTPHRYCTCKSCQLASWNKPYKGLCRTLDGAAATAKHILQFNKQILIREVARVNIKCSTKLIMCHKIRRTRSGRGGVVPFSGSVPIH
jgi:hypothetical protein